MLLKIIGAIVLLIASISYGFLLSNDFIKRINCMEKFYNSLIMLKGEISYNNSGIKCAIENISQNDDSLIGRFYKKVLEVFQDGNTSIKEAWNISAEDILKKEHILKNEDITLIAELGLTIGVTDRETQINNINYIMEKAKTLISGLMEIKEEKCKIYKMLGVVAGMFITIIII